MIAKYIHSAAYMSQMPKPSRPEFCIIGRSNVGKSSFINHLFHNKKLAKVSKTPGKTVLANFYEVDDGTMWVDLPGYGYAKTSQKQTHRLSRLITTYCNERKSLAGILWLLDIRHPGTGADLEVAQWLNTLNLHILPILTKSDKITNNRRRQLVRDYMKTFGFKIEPVTYSILTEKLRNTFEQRYSQWKQSIIAEQGP